MMILCGAQEVYSNFFLQCCSLLAIPVGTCALYENTVRIKARTGDKSYLPNKPQPYGIRFYAVLGPKYTYLHNLFDNGSGNLTGISRPQEYTSVLPYIKPLYNILCQKQDCNVDKHSSSAL